MIFTDFIKALGQLTDPRFRRVLLLGIGFAIIVMVLIYVIMIAGLNSLVSIFAPSLADQTMAQIIGFGSLIFVVILSFFLMVPVASLITSFFLDDVADAVEAKYYPSFPLAQRVNVWQGFIDTVRFFGIMVLFNVIAFFAALVMPPLAPFIFFGTNGYLLGREYFQLVAIRRLGRQTAQELFKANRIQVWWAGCLMALPLTLPLVNLFIPILGAATFTHFFHRVWDEQSL